MRAAVVLNAKAGADVGRASSPDEIIAALRERGVDAALVGTADEPIGERICRAIDDRPDMVIVGGGDGSIGCAAQKLMGTDIPLGILPLGTMNLLAKDLGLPLDIAGAIDVIARGESRHIDVGTLNGQVFLCKSMIGLPANIAQLRERGRGSMNVLSWLRLVRAFAVGLTRYPPLSLGLRIDGRMRRVRARAIAVSCNAYDAGFGRVLKRSQLDAGELVLYIPHGLTFWKLLRLGAGLATGTWQNQEGLESHKLRSMVVMSPRPLLRIMLDGEVSLMTPPLRFRIRPRALRVMAPPPETAEPTETT
ncbi:diacylglycerol/lipid kinase family protein [Terrihabitans sp. B22-R8]|uniref:diacylglycerol/lipid kinase family protein n=1 Tax=Terrihabitans sp. B22-R8 TaxID=3425128 RepID=UPI00403CA5EA